MNESGAGAAAPMSREGVDHALRGLRSEKERISAALLDLDGHHGSRLLEGARLTGETWRRWDQAQARLAMLWRVFDAYQRVLDAAGELRDRQTRPDAATLAELSGLLTGPAVELPDGEIPLERRTLLGPQERRATLDEAVEMMSAAYEFVAGEIAAADAAWTALLMPLEEAEETWRDTARLAHSLDGGARRPELDRLGRELTALGSLVRTDPLSQVRDGRADTTRLDRVRTALGALRDELAEMIGLRDEYGTRVAQITGRVEDAEAAARRALEARETALIKIVSPGLPDPPPSGGGLRERLGDLDALRAAGRWADLARHVADLEREAGSTLERARADLVLSTGLLDRRGELRGRLEAYRAKAARLGLAEDELLTPLYERARELLWTAPCDLRASTAAVAEYQRAIRACESETGTRR